MTIDERLKQMRITTFQSRMGQKEDDIRRKQLDNSKRLISTPTDCIRVRARNTFEGDKSSIIPEKADVVSIVFPPMKDVPIRKIRKNKDNPGHYQLTSLVATHEEGEQQKMFTCECLHFQDIDVGDLIFRILSDNSQDCDTVLIMEVTELLGDIGEHEVITYKFNATIPTYEIPKDLIDTIGMMVERRRKLGY